MSNRANIDQLVAIWALAKLGWSSRRIARLKLPTSHHTITAYHQTACGMAKANKLPILAKGEGAVRFRYCEDIENVDAVRNSGKCGGGRRVRKHIDDAYDGVSEE